MQITITNDAQEKLRELLSESSYAKPAIRLIYAGIGWGGPKLGLALDESKDRRDTILDIENIKIILDENVKNIIGSSMPIDIYYHKAENGSGFMVDLGASCHM